MENLISLFACAQLVARRKTRYITIIFGIMGLCIKKGDEIVVTVEGPDEDQAAEKMETLFRQQL